MKLRLFAFVILCFALTSCQQIIDNYWDRKEEENFTSSYMGIYKGNYSGDETGTLTIEVSDKGYVTLTKVSPTGSETHTSGIAREDGALQSVALPSGFTLYGNLITKSGTWKTGILKGNWSVVKQ
ncbi:hypothetical protein [Chryseobacterium sp.]|uniref:hypothetical protein n=1 Tax=Chryseobacterium sp. TaxID=1871047 RepID=UPI0012A91C8C|nr:hypothetical protein [Chryseobacterium sp.]QFG54093.1 hypothetical protein F7R58_11235 [Chryseobacterium sp.]